MPREICGPLRWLPVKGCRQRNAAGAFTKISRVQRSHTGHMLHMRIARNAWEHRDAVLPPFAASQAYLAALNFTRCVRRAISRSPAL